MIKRRTRSDLGRGRSESAFMLGECVGVERVLPGQVLRVNESLGAGDPGSKLGCRFPRLALAVVCVAGRGEISLRQLGALGPLASRDARAQAHAVAAGRRAEYPRDACALEASERIVLDALFQRGDGANGGGEQCDLARKNVAEQAGDAQRHIDPRPAEHRQRQDFEAADACRCGVPGRPAADQREGLREIIAAGAHGRRAPKVEHDALRPFAMVLRVTRQDLLGGAPADLPGVAGRGRARIDGVEIAAGRQNVETPARRGARRPWRYERPPSARNSPSDSAAPQAATRSPSVSRAAASSSSPAKQSRQRSRAIVRTHAGRRRCAFP